MTARTYIELFDHVPHLTLKYAPADPLPWRIIDQSTGEQYAPAATFPQARRFLEAAERKGDATVNWANVALHQSLSASLAITAAMFPGSGGEGTGVASVASPDHFSRRVPHGIRSVAPPTARQDTLPEREEAGRKSEQRSSGFDSYSSASRSGNVLPFRRMSEPIDESTIVKGA